MTTVRHPAPEAPTRRLGVGRAFHGLLRITEWVVLGVAVVACVVFSVGTLTGRLLLQTVPTGSMEPVIPKGSAIMVEHKDVSAIEVGDVIVFAAPETGTMTVHRVIEIGETDGTRTFTTKGDNNPGPDPWNLQLSGQKVHEVSTVLPVLGTVLTKAGEPRPGSRSWSSAACSSWWPASSPSGAKTSAARPSALPSDVRRSSSASTPPHPWPATQRARRAQDGRPTTSTASADRRHDDAARASPTTRVTSP